MELKAPAKVNFHLAVGPRRADGYHPIMSVFQTCSLCDTLDVSLAPGPFHVDVTGLEGLCEKGKSTLDKAALLWHEMYGLDGKLTVRVTKNIPSQAGLGGGSSDAASLILWLNGKTGRNLPKEELMAFGARIGCDVPFFVSQCRAAIVSGVGEIVRPIEARTDLEGFIIIPKSEKVSTAEAYRALDSRETIPELESAEELEREYRRPFTQWAFRNDFELVNMVPEIEVPEGERLLLTGSGSCRVLLTERKKLTASPLYESVHVSF